MKKVNFQKIYEKAPREKVEELLQFRSSHLPKQITIYGIQWTYLCTGRKDKTLLLLPGGLGKGEMSFPHIATLEEEYRVISPDYPAVPTMGELVDGIRHILKSEGVRRAHVAGGSYGGMVAQCFVRKYPEMVDKLVLSHTLFPKADHAKRARIFFRILKMIPLGLLRFLFSRKIHKYLDPIPDVADFWIAYITETLAQMNKADFVMAMKRGMDFNRYYTFDAGDLAHWRRRILILDSDDDPMVLPEDRDALLELYPVARHHRFHGTGHTASVAKPEEFLSVLRDFLSAA